MNSRRVYHALRWSLRFDGFFFDAPSAARGPRHLGLGGQWIGCGDSAEDEEEDGVGGNVEVEIDKAVQEQARDAGDGGSMDGAGEVTLLGFVGATRIAEQDKDES